MNGLIAKATGYMTRFGSKMLFKVSKASPEILIGGGVLAVVAGTVLACKATKDELGQIVDEAEAKIREAHEAAEEHVITEKEETALVWKARTTAVGRILGAYAPAAAVGAVGIAMIFTSHGIMRKRNAALLAAYNTLDTAFKKYRERVRAEDGGKEADRKYLTGEAYPKEYDEVLDGADVAEVNKQAREMIHNDAPYGPYTFEYSKWTARKWSVHPESNANIIRAAEDYGTRQLELNGHVFLNDILDFLNMDKVPWGQLVGWIRGSKEGDSYVQLLDEETMEMLELDNDGWKKPIWLEANCDGIIWDKI